MKLHIDDSITPVAQPHRRIPFHVRKQLEEQLEKDEQQGVIECVDGPTPWVSPVVVAPKPKQPGKIRMCVDMRRANHITPTVREIIGDLNGARIFNKLDLNQGKNQLELTPDSRYITTFSTHLGLRRFTRLNFGVSSAAEIFQNVIRETLNGIPGVTNISDDILVYGSSQEDHDKALAATFQRLREKGLTLNLEKCVYSQSSLSFLAMSFQIKAYRLTLRKWKKSVAEEFVDYLVQTSTPNALKLEDIQSATQRDPTLRAVIEAIQTGNWHKPGKRQGINTAVYNAIQNGGIINVAL